MASIDTNHAFQSISDTMVATHDGVEPGRMMSHPAIAYRGKVFAFRGSRNDMVFRLGAGFDVGVLGVTTFELLAPFKTKPPMKDWFRIAASDAGVWPDLAERALDVMRPTTKSSAKSNKPR
ncbi:MAG: hypothetical protein AAF414_05465 [Pseudomonadota bacterium]